MSRKQRSVEEIIGKLREAEVAMGQGESVAQVSRHIGVSTNTLYGWRQEYGGLRIDQARITNVSVLPSCRTLSKNKLPSL